MYSQTSSSVQFEMANTRDAEYRRELLETHPDSFRSRGHVWDPPNQRPELWNLFNTRSRKGETMLLFTVTNLESLNRDGIERGINPIDSGSTLHIQVMKTDALKQALDLYGFDAAFAGARRDEEKSRAKERIFSKPQTRTLPRHLRRLEAESIEIMRDVCSFRLRIPLAQGLRTEKGGTDCICNDHLPRALEAVCYEMRRSRSTPFQDRSPGASSLHLLSGCAPSTESILPIVRNGG